MRPVPPTPTPTQAPGQRRCSHSPGGEATAADEPGDEEGRGRHQVGLGQGMHTHTHAHTRTYAHTHTCTYANTAPWELTGRRGCGGCGQAPFQNREVGGRAAEARELLGGREAGQSAGRTLLCLLAGAGPGGLALPPAWHRSCPSLWLTPKAPQNPNLLRGTPLWFSCFSCEIRKVIPARGG